MREKEITSSQQQEKTKQEIITSIKLPELNHVYTNETTGNLFVNYNLNNADRLHTYPIMRIPKHGCIVRSYRIGNTNRRGFKEESFQNSIKKYFGNYFEVLGNVRLNTGKETRPYEPDIAIIDKNKDKNIRIDVEIDEPYAAITRQPTHCKDEDWIRDNYFVDRGWIVVRFSEFQVHTQELECLKFLAYIIRLINPNYIFSQVLNPPNHLKTDNLWDIVQAQKWEKENYREQYLGHNFGIIPENYQNVERGFSKQEILEEELVTKRTIGVVENSNNIGFNKVNEHNRDKRILFYPDSHIYTIDGVPSSSASTIINKFFPEFDSYGKAATLSPNNPLYGLAIEEIVKIWDNRGKESATKGKKLHEQIEKYYLKQTFIETEEFQLFRQFVSDHFYLKPYRSEWRIFDEQYNIAGTIDLITKSTFGFEIYD